MSDESKPLSTMFTGLTFAMRPGTSKNSMRSLLKLHGGLMLGQAVGDAIRLTDNIGDKQGVHVDFVLKSIDCGHLLNMEEFRLPDYAKSLNGVTSTTVSVNERDLMKGRRHYQPEEDQAIIDYVATNGRLEGPGSVKGNLFWKIMEYDKITTHSWQSMKDRYMTYLKEKVPAFRFQPLLGQEGYVFPLLISANQHKVPSVLPENSELKSLSGRRPLADNVGGDLAEIPRKRQLLAVNNRSIYCCSPSNPPLSTTAADSALPEEPGTSLLRPAELCVADSANKSPVATGYEPGVTGEHEQSSEDLICSFSSDGDFQAPCNNPEVPVVCSNVEAADGMTSCPAVEAKEEDAMASMTSCEYSGIGSIVETSGTFVFPYEDSFADGKVHPSPCSNVQKAHCTPGVDVSSPTCCRGEVRETCAIRDGSIMRGVDVLESAVEQAVENTDGLTKTSALIVSQEAFESFLQPGDETCHKNVLSASSAELKSEAHCIRQLDDDDTQLSVFSSNFSTAPAEELPSAADVDSLDDALTDDFDIQLLAQARKETPSANVDFYVVGDHVFEEAKDNMLATQRLEPSILEVSELHSVVNETTLAYLTEDQRTWVDAVNMYNKISSIDFRNADVRNYLKSLWEHAKKREGVFDEVFR